MLKLTCIFEAYKQTIKIMAAVKTLSVKEGESVNIDQFPNFDKSGNVSGMKKLYYGKDALLVKCGNYIYNVTSEPSIYEQAN